MSDAAEVWLPVVGYEEYYKVSSIGRIYSVRTNKILVPFINAKGYAVHSLNVKRKPFTRTAHRLMMAAFCGVSDMQIDHINGDKLDNRLENLEYVTPRENSVRFRKTVKRDLPLGVVLQNKKYYGSSYRVNNEQVWLGTFKTPEEASLAYQNAVAAISSTAAGLERREG